MAKDTPFDPYEIGARNSDPELGALQPMAPAPPRMPPLKLLGLLAVAGLALAVVQGGIGGSGPSVDGSCSKPAVAFDKDSVDQYAVVRWKATGPSGSTVVLGLDRAEGDLTVPTGEALVARSVLSECLADGRFGLRAEPGAHTVTAYLVTDGTVSVLSTTKLVVTAP